MICREDGAAADFSDVERNAWYAPYIAAAQKNGFISGVGDGMFGVGRNITRQDMAKILYGIMHDKKFAVLVLPNKGYVCRCGANCRLCKKKR